MSAQNVDVVVKKIDLLISKYNRWATYLQVATVILTALAIVLSIAIGFFVGVLPETWIKIMAGFAALSTSIVTAFHLPKKAQDMRDAFRYLQSASFRYKTIEEYGITNLIDAYDNAEKTIGHVEIEEAFAAALARSKNKA